MKLYLVTKRTGKSGQEVLYYSKYFNSNYIEFVGYEKCDKLLCKSVEGLHD